MKIFRNAAINDATMKINNRHIYIIIDPKIKNLHTTCTSMPKAFRPFEKSLTRFSLILQFCNRIFVLLQ